MLYKNQQNKIITITRISTPLGPIWVGALNEGICLCEFADRRMSEIQLNRVRKLFKAELILGSNKHLDELNIQLKEYFEGKRKEFSVPLVTPGTPFQQKVWAALQRIPYGETRSYKDQAAMIGNPKAVRAVGRANGENRIAIIIPCHRVMGKNGYLIGYGGGLWRKQFLLSLESENI